uniref:Alpha/beta hydrolase n=1 Tax=viral metagenome TaxID=1070528 RepID=A0A6C0F5P3_9ZZZZ|tara:strand:+ start:18016 stop:18660 length:645 start_codon:yes stop_codon:yes gene_type:complete
MYQDVYEFIDNNLKTYNEIEYVHKHNNEYRTLYIIFAGAIDKFVCISWFYEIDYNCLWIKDTQPYMSYTNPEFSILIDKYSQMYNNVVMFGMSMGGIGALIHSQNITNCNAVIAIDCEPRGINEDDALNLITNVNKCKIHLISCSNQDEQIFHNKLAQKFNNVIIEKCPRKEHLSNIPSKKYLIALFDLYGNIPYDAFYVNAWDKKNEKEFQWN